MFRRLARHCRDFLRLSAHIQLLPVLENGEETLVGGQAVMEGVMMRAPHSYCVAVRRASGEIVTEQAPLARPSEKRRIWGWPVLRGLGTLGQAMVLGLRALRFSANAALDDHAVAAGEQGRTSKPRQFSGTMLAINIAFSVVFFIFMYKFVPLYLATELGKFFPAFDGRLAINFVDGVVRLAIFFVFLGAVSMLKDIRRVFEYHGAEHKVVFNFESGKSVNIENAQQFVTWHPRCGTSFLLVVMVLSMCFYMFLPFDTFLARFIARILLLPLIVGVSYELIRYAAKRRGGLLATLTAPGLWLQRVTTKPPADDQVAVSIQALEGAMALEEAQGGELVIA